MKRKIFNLFCDMVDVGRVYVVMARFGAGDWQVLFVQHDKEMAYAAVRRWRSECEPEAVYRIIETELL